MIDREARNVTAKHVAWFSFKEGVSDDRIDEHMRAVRTLVDVVPVVSGVDCGKSYTDRAGGLTHCIIVTLPDRESLPRYLEHPAHLPIAEALVGDIAELRVMDLDLG
jgi:Stress responsive A/B Barrel Domain